MNPGRTTLAILAGSFAFAELELHAEVIRAHEVHSHHHEEESQPMRRQAVIKRLLTDGKKE